MLANAVRSTIENIWNSYCNGTNLNEQEFFDEILQNKERDDLPLFIGQNDATEDGYLLIHLVCKYDHNKILEYFISQYGNKYLIEKTRPAYKFSPKLLPLEIALNHNAKKCLEELLRLDIESKLLILRNLNSDISLEFTSKFIANIKHKELLAALSVSNDSITDFPPGIKRFLKERKELFYENILKIIEEVTDVRTVIKYIVDTQFEPKSECGTNILIHVLTMESKEQKFTEKSTNLLKIAAFLVVKGVNYSFNSKNPFTDIPQLDYDKINKIRKFVSEILALNRNETPRILSFSTISQNISQASKESILKTYCTLYCDNEEFSKEEDYFRPIMDVVICSHPKIECDINITKIAFPANHNDKGLVDVIENKIFFSFNDNDAETRGIIIHEFCHMANYILYKNKARPYIEGDVITREKYLKVLNELKERENLDEIIKLAWSKAYPTEEDQIAELIVRVPHMLAKYGYEKGVEYLNTQAPQLIELYKNYFLKDCNRFIIDKKNDLFAIKSSFNQINIPGASIEASLAHARFLMNELKFKEAIKFFGMALNQTNNPDLVQYIFNQKLLCEHMAVMFDSQPTALVGELHLFSNAFQQARILIIQQNDFKEGIKWIHNANKFFLKCKEDHNNHPILAEFIIFKTETFMDLSILDLRQIEHMNGCSENYKDKAKSLTEKICDIKNNPPNRSCLSQFTNKVRNYGNFIKEHSLLAITGTVTTAAIIAPIIIYKRRLILQ